LFGSLEGREGEGFGKKEGASGRNKRHWRERALGVNFLFIIQNPPHLGELKNCIGEGFLGVLEGLYEFLKFNLCCYNILKIKNILIMCISLSLSKKVLFQKMRKISPFLYIILTLQNPLFPSPPNSQTKPKRFLKEWD